MVLDDIVSLVRRRLEDVDPNTAEYADYDLMVALSDARRMLAVRQVQGMSGYVLDLDAGTIAPEPTDEDSVILALRATVDLLRDRYRAMLLRGEFGISWRSGLEEESSIEAAKQYTRMVTELDHELQALLVTKARLSILTRPQ